MVTAAGVCHDALLIVHSDGLTTQWSPGDYPGPGAKHARLIAGVLYRDHDRGRDDDVPLVVKQRATDRPHMSKALPTVLSLGGR
jgi:hypothetical protein